MTLIVIGALLIVLGVVLAANNTIRHGRMSQPPESRRASQRMTLEPTGRGRRLSFKADIPGVALFLLGVILIFAGLY